MGISAFGASGIKPGVCTSTTRPSAPYEGMMIYETDTNRVLVWDNAAWVMIADTDTPPGLELVSATTFTTSGTINLTLPSTYENFRVLLKVSAASTTLEVFAKLTLASTASDTGYTNYLIGGPNSETISGGAYWKLGGSYSTVQEMSASFDLIDATNALRTEILGNLWGSNTAGGLLIGTNVGVHTSATAYDGFRIYTSTGTITGNVRLYGYRNS